jgi:hypothetical protein
MPLKKLLLKPGVNRENTRYTNEGGWYDCDKIRFRQGTPEKIGGWVQTANTRFLGVCRSLLSWVTLRSVKLLGVGTNLKMYIQRGSEYVDITPIRETTAAGAVTFEATNGSSVLVVFDTLSNVRVGDFVTYSGAVSLGGNVTAEVLNREHQVASIVSINSYRIVVNVTATAADTGDGGSSTVGAYQVSVGPSGQDVQTGWGGGPWGLGAWGIGLSEPEPLRIWNQANYGQDLIFGPRGGGLFYWQDSGGEAINRGFSIAGLPEASDVPLFQNKLLVSDVSRFVLCFGANDVGQTTLDPMLVRWSDQEDFTQWTPSITNQAGSLRLSSGSQIVTAIQTRQEIVIFTDTAVYALQYQGPPYVWGAQILGDNTSIMGPNAVATASNVTYWMGADKFYRYDGRVQTLRCDLRQYIFQDFNFTQNEQVFAGTVEEFSEIWWWYPSQGSEVPNRYVVYNYEEDIWYYGTMTRTAWLDSKIVGKPISAYANRILQQETGVDDASEGTPAPIAAYITSSEIDIDEGDRFGFVWRILPDVTFRGSSAANPQLTMSLLPLQNSGSGYQVPASVAGTNSAPVTRTAVFPVEQFTGIIYTRVRGRQMSMKVESTGLGVNWQLGAPRIDVKPDGRR